MEKYIEMLIEGGAYRAEKIDTKSVVTAPWVAFKCKYGCGTYGKSRSCPPVAPTWQQTREMADCYKYGILFCSHDVKTITPAAMKVARQMFLDGYYKVIAFGSGACRKCEKCNMEKCNFPGTTLPTMEGCGIDVYATAHNNGFEIYPVQNKGDEANFYGLLFVE